MKQPLPLVFPLLSVNIGQVSSGTYKGKEAKSGIGKSAVEGAVRVTPNGCAGDEQADLVHHGGEDKAICVYSFEHYPHWEKVLDRKLAFGSFGENATVARLTEGDVCIGDIFHIGSAVVQISQPRVPCWKLAMRLGLEEMPKLVIDKGASGFYFRVLVEGHIRAGDEVELTERHTAGVTVAEANRVMHHDVEDEAGIRSLLAVDALSPSWREALIKRLSKLDNGR